MGGHDFLSPMFWWIPCLFLRTVFLFGRFFFCFGLWIPGVFTHFFRPGLLRTLRALRTPQFAWKAEEAKQGWYSLRLFQGVRSGGFSWRCVGILWHFSGCVLYIKMGGGQEEEQAVACLSDSWTIFVLFQILCVPFNHEWPQLDWRLYEVMSWHRTRWRPNPYAREDADFAQQNIRTLLRPFSHQAAIRTVTLRGHFFWRNNCQQLDEHGQGVVCTESTIDDIRAPWPGYSRWWYDWVYLPRRFL